MARWSGSELHLSNVKRIFAFGIFALSVQPVAAQMRPLPSEVAVSCETALPDQDGDSLSDVCELMLAQYFAPLLMIAPGGCNWDDSVEPARLGGGYLFAVQSAGANGCTC